MRSATLGESASYVLGAEAKRGSWIDYVMACTWSIALLPGFSFAHGFDIVIESTLPMGAGLASSAALGTAVIRAIDDSLLPKDIAVITHAAEVGFIDLAIGMMDNLCCAFGAAGQAIFIDCESKEQRIVSMPSEASIAVVHSGVTHANASSGYATRRAECETACGILGVTSLRHARAFDDLPDPLRRRARHVVTENARVLATVEALEAIDLARVGRLFDESHASMRDDYEITVPEVDRLVEALRAEEGVYGARMTGGGFGGCVIALVQKGAEKAVQRAISKCPGARSIPLR